MGRVDFIRAQWDLEEPFPWQRCAAALRQTLISVDRMLTPNRPARTFANGCA